MYLLVIAYSEEETYFFSTLNEMLEHFKVSSINEILTKENTYYQTAIVYRISDIYLFSDD